MTGETVVTTDQERRRGASDDAGREPDVSVVIPIVGRCDDLVEIFRALAERLEGRGKTFEFVFVMDGGVAEPPDGLRSLARADPAVRLLLLKGALGETAALRAGFDVARGDVIVTSSAYWQVEPEAVDRVLDGIEGGYDVVVCRRWPRRDGWLNRLQNRAFHSVVRRTTGMRFRDMACGFRALKSDVARSLTLYGDLHRFLPGLAEQQGYRVAEVEVPQHPSDSGTRVYRPGVYVRRLLDICTFYFLVKFTEKPLRFFGLFGAGLAAIGGGLGGVLTIQRLGGQGIANRPLLLLSVLLVVLGVQLVGLGLVGEIIVHLRTSRSSRYRVERVG